MWADSTSTLAAASHKSKHFDECLNAQWNVGKGSCFSLLEADEANLSDALQLVGPIDNNVVQLGVQVDVRDAHNLGTNGMRNAAVKEAGRQLKRITLGANTYGQKIVLIQQLVTPKIRWGAAWQTFPEKDMRQ